MFIMVTIVPASPARRTAALGVYGFLCGLVVLTLTGSSQQEALNMGIALGLGATVASAYEWYRDSE